MPDPQAPPPGLDRPSPPPSSNDDGPPSADVAAERLIGALTAVAENGLHIHIHHHSPIPPDGPPPPFVGQILAAIQGISSNMSKTSDAIADLSAADDELATELKALLADVQGFPAVLQKALADAGVDDATNATAVEAAATVTKTFTASILAALNPNPPTSVQISPAEIDGTVGTAVSGQFTANLDGNLTWSATDAPPDFTINADGTFSCPAANVEAGNFDVSVSSDTGETGEASIAYNIAAAS